MISIYCKILCFVGIILFISLTNNIEHFGVVGDCANGIAFGVWDQLKEVVQLRKLPGVIITFVTGIKRFFENLKKVISNITGMPQKIFNKVKSSSSKISNKIKSIPEKLKKMGSNLKGILVKIKDKMLKKVKSITNSVVNSIKKITQYLKDFKSNIKQSFSNMKKIIIQLPKNVVEGIYKILKGILNPLGSFFKNNKIFAIGLIVLVLVMFVPLIIKVFSKKNEDISVITESTENMPGNGSE